VSLCLALIRKNKCGELEVLNSNTTLYLPSQNARIILLCRFYKCESSVLASQSCSTVVAAAETSTGRHPGGARGVHRSVNMEKDSEEKNAYEVVGIGSDATEADIKKAYRQRSLKTHPDRVRRAFLVACVGRCLYFLRTSESPSQRCRCLHLSSTQCHFDPDCTPSS
jgi:hypothetical protein